MIERSFVPIRSGLVHVAACGSGRPVLLLHQTPRSWDEFRDVLPLLGRSWRAIAMDTVGFGESTPLPAGQDSIEAWAAAALELLTALGHDTARRAASMAKKVVDEVTPSADGRHLVELWAMRQAFYPEKRGDLLERFMIDALRAGPRAAEGHRVVGRYVMEPRLALVRCPTLVIAPTGDPHAYPHAARVARDIAGSTLVEIENAMVPLPDHMPEEFAAVVERFLSGLPAA